MTWLVKKYPPNIYARLKGKIIRRLQSGVSSRETENIIKMHLNERYNFDLFARYRQRSSQQSEIIQRDLNRTFGDEDEDLSSCSLQLETWKFQLQEILTAISHENQEIEYIQGWNMIVGAMIRQSIKKELIFGFFNVIMRKAHYEKIYLEDFSFQKVLNVQVLLHLRKELPEVHQKLAQLGINLQYITLRWFCAFFSADLTRSLLLRIWILFCVQSWKVLVKTCLVLFHLYQNEILAINDEDLLNDFLKNFLSDGFSKDFSRQAKFFDVYNTFKVTNSHLSQIEKAYSTNPSSIESLIWITVDGSQTPRKIVWAEKGDDIPEILLQHKAPRTPHRLFQHSCFLYCKENKQAEEFSVIATSFGRQKKFQRLEKLEHLEISNTNPIQLSFSFDRESSNKENIQTLTLNMQLLEPSLLLSGQDQQHRSEEMLTSLSSENLSVQTELLPTKFQKSRSITQSLATLKESACSMQQDPRSELENDYLILNQN